MQGKHPSADGSFGEANAAKQSRIPREQLVEAAAVSHMVRQYLQKLEQQNPGRQLRLTAVILAPDAARLYMALILPFP